MHWKEKEENDGVRERKRKSARLCLAREIFDFSISTPPNSQSQQVLTIKNDDVWLTPCGSSEDNLDLLTSGKTSHGVVGNEFSFETEIFEVLFDFTTNERTQHTSLLGFLGVDLLVTKDQEKRRVARTRSVIGILRKLTSPLSLTFRDTHDHDLLLETTLDKFIS